MGGEGWQDVLDAIDALERRLERGVEPAVCLAMMAGYARRYPELAAIVVEKLGGWLRRYPYHVAAQVEPLLDGLSLEQADADGLLDLAARITRSPNATARRCLIYLGFGPRGGAARGAVRGLVLGSERDVENLAVLLGTDLANRPAPGELEATLDTVSARLDPERFERLVIDAVGGNARAAPPAILARLRAWLDAQMMARWPGLVELTGEGGSR